MSNKLIHTPEGVRDIYDGECRRKLAVQNKILDTFYLYGFQHIQTPSFEYFDIFSEDRGSVPSREMFKFFDRDNNTLVLRPDMTPAVARFVTKYFMDETMPLRLCYLERTFKNNTSYQGRLKERTETGAEMIGDDTGDGDAEMLALVIDCLKAAGLKEFQIELGHVEFYRGLLEDAGLEDEAARRLGELIENKNFFGAEELLKSQPGGEALMEIILKLPGLFGDIGRIRSARALTSNPRALAAIDRLERVHEILDAYGLSQYVSYDLGMLSGYRYYTGVIFKAYTYGTGDYIATGGRYDRLLEQFGKEAPAVGFAIVVDQLMAALSRQGIDVPCAQVNTMILYERSARMNAIRLASFFRGRRMAVQCLRKGNDTSLEEYRQMAVRGGLRNVLYLPGDGRVVEAVEAASGRGDRIPLSEYLPDEG